MIKTVNAMIRSVALEYEDHGILTCWLHLDYGGSCQGFGGYSLDKHNKDKKCKLARIPKSNVDFWKSKIEQNSKRDERNWRKLRSQGWRVIVVWECQLNDMRFLDKLFKRLQST